MSEYQVVSAEFLTQTWEAYTKRVIAMMTQRSETWRPDGPPKATAKYFITEIRNMPVPTVTDHG